MKLIGATASPYVRRIRLLLADRPYQFVDLDIYDKDRAQLRHSNPALRIPTLQDGERTVHDSRVIFRYLSAKFGLPPLDWDEENLLTLIDAANDSLVMLRQLQVSGLDIDRDLLFFNLQRERVASSLRELDRLVDEGRFAEWRYPAICLYCLIDWIEFRQLPTFAGIESLMQFREHHRTRPAVAATDPRGA